MKSMVSRGALIVLEGVDRVGKTTQALRLVEALREKSYSAQVMSFPNRQTTIGQMISQYLKGDQHLDDRVIHLLFSANRWEVSKQLEETLSFGTTVVVDRYAYSGVAYSSAKGLDIDWCRQSDKGLPKPDSVLYLTASEDSITLREGFGDEKYERRDFQQKVKQCFDKLCEDYWKTINANKSEDDLHKELMDSVLKTIEMVSTSGDNKIKHLWIDV